MIGRFHDIETVSQDGTSPTCRGVQGRAAFDGLPALAGPRRIATRTGAGVTDPAHQVLAPDAARARKDHKKTTPSAVPVAGQPRSSTSGPPARRRSRLVVNMHHLGRDRAALATRPLRARVRIGEDPISTPGWYQAHRALLAREPSSSSTGTACLEIRLRDVRVPPRERRGRTMVVRPDRRRPDSR